MADGTIKIDTSLDTKGLQSAMAGLGSVVSMGMKSATVAIGAATTAFAGLSVKALKLGGDLEQSVGGIETLFKGSSEIVIANAKKAYQTAGVDAVSYMNQVTSFSASLLQSLGGDTEKAAKVADMAIIDMSDNANKMGTSIGSIQDAYQGFAKQQYMMLDNLKLGYGQGKQEMERLLADAEKLSGTKYDISNLNDVFEAIHVIQQELDITGTTAKEGMETLTGSLTTAKAAFSNFLSGAGDVDSFTSSFSNAMNIVADRIKELLPRLSSGFAQIFQQLAPQVPALIVPLAAEFVKGGLVLLQGLAQGIASNKAIIGQAVADIGEIIVTGIFGTDIKSHWDKFVGDMTASFGTFSSVVGASMKPVGAIIEGTFKFILDNSALIISALTGIGTAMAVLAIAPTLLSLTSGVSGLAHAFAGLAKQTSLFTAVQLIATKALNASKAALIAHPYLALAAVIGTVVGGLVLYSNATNKASAGTQKLIDDTKDQIQAMDDLSASIENSKKSYESQMFDIDSSATVARGYVAEIETMVDAEGRLTGSKEQLLQAVKNLNIASPDLGVQFNEETNALNMSTEAMHRNIDALQERAKAQAMSERMVEVEKEKLRVSHELGEADKKREEITNNLTAAERKGKEGREEMAQSGEDWSKQLGELNSGAQDLEQQLASLNNESDELAAGMEQAGSSTGSFVDGMDGAANSVEALAEAERAAAAAHEEYVNSIVNGFERLNTESGKNLQTMAENWTFNEQASQEWTANLDKIIDGGLKGVAATFEKEGIEKSANMTKELADIYVKLGEGISLTDAEVAILHDMEAINASILSGAEEVKQTVSEAGKESGSGYNEGMSESITEGQDTVKQAVQDNIQNAASADVAEGDFSASGTAINTAIATSITSGQDIISSALKEVISSSQASAMSATSSFNTLGDSIVKSIVTGITAQSTSVSTAMTGILTAAKATLTPATSEFNTLGSGLAKGIGTGITSQSSAVTTAMTGIINDAKNILTSAASSFNALGTSLSKNVGTGVSSQSGAVSAAMTGVIAAAKAAGLAASSGTTVIGSQMAAGVARGLESGSGAIAAAAQRIIKNAISAMEAAAAIASPSKETMVIGKFLDEGLAIGLKNNAKIVAQAAKNVMDKTLSVFEKSAENLLQAKIDSIDEEIKESERRNKEIARLDDIAAKNKAVAEAKNAEAKEKAQKDLNSTMEKYRIEDLKSQKEALEEGRKLIEEQQKEIRRMQEYALDEEVRRVKDATDAKIAEYDREYAEKLKLIDEESYEAIRAIEKEIKAIEDKTKAEDKAAKKQAFDDDLAKQYEDLWQADTPEKQAEIQKKIDDMLAKQEREAELEDRQSKKDSLKAEIDGIKDAAASKKKLLEDETKENEKKLEEQKQYFKDLADREVAIAHEKNEDLKRLMQEDLETFKQTYAAKAALQGSTDLYEQTISDIEKKLSEAIDNDERKRLQKQLDEMKAFKDQYLDIKKDMTLNLVDLTGAAATTTDLEAQKKMLDVQAGVSLQLQKDTQGKAIVQLESYYGDVEKITADNHKKLDSAQKKEADKNLLFIKQINSNIVATLQSYAPSWYSVGQSFMQNLINGLQSKLSALNGVVSQITSSMDSIGAGQSAMSFSVPMYGTGGIVTTPRLAVVGDAPEAIIPLSQLSSILTSSIIPTTAAAISSAQNNWNSASSGAGSAGTIYNTNVAFSGNINSSLDIEAQMQKAAFLANRTERGRTGATI